MTGVHRSVQMLQQTETYGFKQDYQHSLLNPQFGVLFWLISAGRGRRPSTNLSIIDTSHRTRKFTVNNCVPIIKQLGPSGLDRKDWSARQ